MTTRPRYAVTLPGPATSAPATVELARRAERAGYGDLWLADAGGLDALTLAAVVAQATERARIGVAVVPVYTRTPAVLGATVATIAGLAPGRFVLGLGTSSHTMIEQWHGLALEQPLARIRDTVTVLRAIFAGEKTAFDGETLRSHGYRQPAIDGGQPVYLAALRPRMLELAAGIGDGVIINLFPRRALPRIREHIRRGAEGAGKSPQAVEVVCRHQIAVTDRPDAARETFRRGFASYYATPVYNQFLAWAGYEEAAREIREGWASGDRKRTAAALSDALIDEIAIIGDREQCRARIAEYTEGGIDTHILSCLGDEKVIDATLSSFAPADRF